MSKVKMLDKVVGVFVDGELVGYADCIIDGYYADSTTGEKLQDNGEYVGLGDFNVEVR